MTKMKNTNSPKRAEYLQGKLEKVLASISSEGDFKAAIISTLDGFSLAAQAEDFDDVKLSAISAIVQDVSRKAEFYIGFKRMDEVSLVDDDKFRLVCRMFDVGENTFILSVVVPPHQSYRKLTNDAIKQITVLLLEKQNR